jgi:Zn-dependent peptidase ImmA (M78 family)
MVADRRMEQDKRTGIFRAQETRGALGLGRGPVHDMFSLIENQGIFLVRSPSGNPNLHAFFAIIEGIPVIYTNSDETLGRQIFSTAHEFCHYLYDQHTLSEVYCNPGVDGTERREVIGDAFAGEFLLPKEGVCFEYMRRFRASPPTEREAIKLMQDFRVSYHAMGYALYRAGLFRSAAAYRTVRDLGSLENKDRLRALILRLGFTTELVEPTVPQCPQRFLEAAIANYEGGVITYAKLRSLLKPWGRRPEDFELREDGLPEV